MKEECKVHMPARQEGGRWWLNEDRREVGESKEDEGNHCWRWEDEGDMGGRSGE